MPVVSKTDPPLLKRSAPKLELSHEQSERIALARATAQAKKRAKQAGSGGDNVIAHPL